MCTPHVHARVHVQSEYAFNMEEEKSTILTPDLSFMAVGLSVMTRDREGVWMFF
jgi:hypothetical protein